MKNMKSKGGEPWAYDLFGLGDLLEIWTVIQSK